MVKLANQCTIGNIGGFIAMCFQQTSSRMAVVNSILYIPAALIMLMCFMPNTARADSLTLSPLRQEISVEAGQAFDGKLTVVNTGNKPAIASISAEAFNVTNEDYDYKLDDSSPLIKWIVFSQTSISLKPAASYSFDYRVNVPIGTGPGGKYISMIASMIVDTGSAGIASVERAASLVYINVPGDTTAKGKLIDINFPKLDTGKDIKAYFRVQNFGNTHFRSRQSITITNILNRKRVSSVATPLLLPGTVRLTNQTLKLGEWPSVYRVTTKVGLGDLPAAERRYWLVCLPIGTTAILFAVGCIVSVVTTIAIKRSR